MGAIRNIFNSRSEKDGIFFGQVKKIIGFSPKNLKCYEEAFTHRSLNLKDGKGNSFNYERLEFLGDAMLGAVIASYLFNEVGRGDEGYLTKMRSKVVSREHLNELGRDLHLLDLARAAIPKENFGINIHGNLFEALVGAIHRDRGYSYAREFIHDRVIDPYVDIEKLEGRVISYKSLVIEWCQKQKMSFNFDAYEDSGQDVIKHFSVRLSIDKKQVAKARGTSKKKAEEKAAKRAYYAFQDKINPQEFN
ncbi:MAG TPA: ribonuclease III [Leeuwenhoekiella sp.]|nr:ribonuclease III [Leeuwenhoekiella sp.]